MHDIMPTNHTILYINEVVHLALALTVLYKEPWGVLASGRYGLREKGGMKRGRENSDDPSVQKQGKNSPVSNGAAVGVMRGVDIIAFLSFFLPSLSLRVASQW